MARKQLIRPWLAADDEALAKLWHSRIHTSIIAAKLRRSQEAVRTRAGKLGLTPRGRGSPPAGKDKSHRPVDAILCRDQLRPR